MFVSPAFSPLRWPLTQRNSSLCGMDFFVIIVQVLDLVPVTLTTLLCREANFSKQGGQNPFSGGCVLQQSMKSYGEPKRQLDQWISSSLEGRSLPCMTPGTAAWQAFKAESHRSRVARGSATRVFLRFRVIPGGGRAAAP